MKVIITESQFNSKVRERLIDSLVGKTEVDDIRSIRSFVVIEKYKYLGKIKYPFHDEQFDIRFNNSEDFTFGMPSLYHLQNWFLLVGVDIDESFKEAEKLRTFYLDKLEVKFKKIINDYLND